MSLIMISMGGALGAIARYLTYLCFQSQNLLHFPWATLFINTLGCLVMGIIMALIDRGGSYHQQLLFFAVTGFLGSYTTFSAFSFENLQLIRANQYGLVMLNISANVMLGLAAIWSGRYIT